MSYCNCKNPEPEQVKHNYIVCMACNLPILQSEDAPEPDIDDEQWKDDQRTDDERIVVEGESISLNHYE